MKFWFNWALALILTSYVLICIQVLYITSFYVKDQYIIFLKTFYST